ncbi:hypothetical protein BDL97_12G092300 [Sphagnum fallax]|nr:hypothetical protein BDL97_12G092300 [Sphagnum fallax]
MEVVDLYNANVSTAQYGQRNFSGGSTHQGLDFLAHQDQLSAVRYFDMNKAAAHGGVDSNSSEGDVQASIGSSSWSSSPSRSARRLSSRVGNIAKGDLSPGSLQASEEVVRQVIDSARAFGYGEEVCRKFRNHFSRLPARYTLNIDVHRHEDVLLHMRLLEEAGDIEMTTCSCSSSKHGESFPLAQVHVRKVELAGDWSLPYNIDESADLPAQNSDKPSSLIDHGIAHCRKAGIKLIPKPAFGSNSNLENLVRCSAGSPKVKVHPASDCADLARSWSTPPRSTSSPLDGDAAPAGGNNGSSTVHHSNPQRSTISHIIYSDVQMGQEAAGIICYSSDHDNVKPVYGYEITLATSDRHGLLNFFTSALTNSTSLQLGIKEAHVFSTTDGMALEVFVVDGWPTDEAEELRQAILSALIEKQASERLLSHRDAKLRAAAESIQLEDWAIDFNQLVLGEKLGMGSTGLLYRGTYLGQDVAIKVMEIEDCHSSSSDSDAPSTTPSIERLQTFIQEVSIMRLVRHKNLVQFIGACSCWPKLCIVTELMAGGSVRDLLDTRHRTSLDIAAAVKVFRDAARGMDFLHRRGVVHRDLKAANLLIDEHDVVKVCDFGVARLKPSPVSSSEKKSFLGAEMTAETGTYRWMAPEVLQHKPYDHKADVYSFGITMWEVLTGQVPYGSMTPLQAAIGVVQRGLRPEIPSHVPERLARLLQDCWHEDPSQRPEFSDMLVVLEEMITPPAAMRKGLFGGRKKKSTSRY